MGVRNNLEKIRLEKGYKFASHFSKFLELGNSQYNEYENNKKQPSLETALHIYEKLKDEYRFEDIFTL